MSGYPEFRFLSQAAPVRMAGLDGWQARIEAIPRRPTPGTKEKPDATEPMLIALASRGQPGETSYTDHDLKIITKHLYPYPNVRLIIQRFSPFAKGNEKGAHPEAVTPQDRFFKIAEEIAASYRVRPVAPR